MSVSTQTFVLNAPKFSPKKTYYKRIIIDLFNRNCVWALEKLKSKEIKVNQLVRCGLRGGNSFICCKDQSAVTTPKVISYDHRTMNGVTDFVFRYL